MDDKFITIESDISCLQQNIASLHCGAWQGKDYFVPNAITIGDIKITFVNNVWSSYNADPPYFVVSRCENFLKSFDVKDLDRAVLEVSFFVLCLVVENLMKCMK